MHRLDIRPSTFQLPSREIAQTAHRDTPKCMIMHYKRTHHPLFSLISPFQHAQCARPCSLERMVVRISSLISSFAFCSFLVHTSAKCTPLLIIYPEKENQKDFVVK